MLPSTNFRSEEINFTLAFIFSLQTGTVMLILFCGSARTHVLLLRFLRSYAGVFALES